MPDTNLEGVARRIAHGLGALPGTAAQTCFAPRPREGSLPPRRPGDRDAAALLLLFERAGRPHVVLTLRAEGLPQHGGQVSLPGGAMEPDETPEAAALREASEEIGVPPAIVDIVGRLSPLHIPVSGFTLHVVVGVTRETPAFAPAPDEVARVIEAPLDELMDPLRIKVTTYEHEGREYDVPYFEVAGLRVWGATAMVLCELLWLVGFRIDPLSSARV